MSEAIVATLMLLLVMLAVIAVRAADLLTAVVVLGAYGFTMSLVWAGIGAVDVAFTEAVVGAGASTVLVSLNRGVMPHEMFMNQVRRFGAEVLPALQAHQVIEVPLE